tara:strand:- start:1848 stop:2585 length:738 start_codon:yes stop_codon:yes gene_type:complete
MSELIPFKDKYLNEKIVLFAPGPTFNDFSYEKYPELEGVKTCALNGVILDDRFCDIFDLWIWAADIDIPQHPTPSYNYIMNKMPYINKKIIKFANCWIDNNIKNEGLLWNVQTQIHPEMAKKLGFVRYNQVVRNIPSDYYCKDLSSKKSGVCIDTGAFHALQILLYMGFSEIILVGFDCGGDHSYKKHEKYENDVCDWNTPANTNALIRYWKKFKSWLNKNYPSINISVINPVGLKNIFKNYSNK